MTSALASQLQVVAASRPQEERLRARRRCCTTSGRLRTSTCRPYTPSDFKVRAHRIGTRAAPVASPCPRRARAPNIQPRNRRRRPLSRDCAFRVPPPWAAAREYVTPQPPDRCGIRRSRSRPIPFAGFNELTRLDGRFEQYSKSLFSRAGSEQNRELMDREANAKLDQQIEGYLRLLSGYYLNPAATKTLEYLIRRYKIHVHNVDAAVTCALPYHSTPSLSSSCSCATWRTPPSTGSRG